MVRVGGRPVLAGSVTETWIYGNSYLPGAHKTHQTGLKYPSDKSDALLTNGKYFTKPVSNIGELNLLFQAVSCVMEKCLLPRHKGASAVVCLLM